jgi:glycosyltransferase involved in cell wall biosynthesis
MTKCLILFSNFPRNSSDSSDWIADFVDKLSDQKIKLYVLAPHFAEASGQEVRKGVQIFRFKYFYPLKYQKLAYGAGIADNINRSILAKLQIPLFIIAELFFSLKIIRKEKINIVNSHWLIPQGIVGAICKRLFNIKHVASVHGSDINLIAKSKILRIVFKFIAQNTDRIIANSSFTKQKILDINSELDAKTQVIPMGVDINKLNDIQTKKSHMTINADYLVLTVGRLIALKGVDYLIRAMNHVIARYPTAKLVICGDGSEKSSLMELVSDLNLTDHVVFTGHIPHDAVAQCYHSADVFVLPSIRIDGFEEGLGVVLLEAMACGIPVIGSNTGGISSIIDDGCNGFLVAEKSPKDLAEKIIILLSDENIREKFKANGLETVRAKYSWDVIIDQYVEAFLR